jgi:hypothetical protein
MTEVAVFRLTEEAQASEVLRGVSERVSEIKDFSMELYRGKEFHYPNNKGKKV